MSNDFQKTTRKPPETGFKAFIKETVETVVIVLILVIIIRNFIAEPRWIPSASMHPTLIEGDNLIIEKISNFISTPKRGDILVFYPPFEKLDPSLWGKFTRLVGYFNKDVAYIKRVIGTPGDKVYIKPGTGVFINGKLLNEPYKLEKFASPCTSDMMCGPFTVPKDKYFMMGDNRNNSKDSRYWGFLPKNKIVGRACFRFWPINRIKILERPKYNIETPAKNNKKAL